MAKSRKPATAAEVLALIERLPAESNEELVLLAEGMIRATTSPAGSQSRLADLMLLVEMWLLNEPKTLVGGYRKVVGLIHDVSKPAIAGYGRLKTAKRNPQMQTETELAKKLIAEGYTQASAARTIGLSVKTLRKRLYDDRQRNGR